MEERDLVDRILNDGSGGVELCAGIGLLLQNGDPQPGTCERERASEPSEACANTTQSV